MTKQPKVRKSHPVLHGIGLVLAVFAPLGLHCLAGRRFRLRRRVRCQH